MPFGEHHHKEIRNERRHEDGKGESLLRWYERIEKEREIEIKSDRKKREEKRRLPGIKMSPMETIREKKRCKKMLTQVEMRVDEEEKTIREMNEQQDRKEKKKEEEDDEGEENEDEAEE